MAKRTVYICDTPECGAVLVHPEDGFVVTGTIKTTTIEGAAKVLVTAPTGSQPDVAAETSFCRDCMAKALGFHAL